MTMWRVAQSQTVKLSVGAKLDLGLLTLLGTILWLRWHYLRIHKWQTLSCPNAVIALYITVCFTSIENEVYFKMGDCWIVKVFTIDFKLQTPHVQCLYVNSNSHCLAVRGLVIWFWCIHVVGYHSCLWILEEFLIAWRNAYDIESESLTQYNTNIEIKKNKHRKLTVALWMSGLWIIFILLGFQISYKCTYYFYIQISEYYANVI